MTCLHTTLTHTHFPGLLLEGGPRVAPHPLHSLSPTAREAETALGFLLRGLNLRDSSFAFPVTSLLIATSGTLVEVSKETPLTRKASLVA